MAENTQEAPVQKPHVSKTQGIQLSADSYEFDLRDNTVTLRLHIAFLNKDGNAIWERTISKAAGTSVPTALIAAMKEALASRTSGSLKHLDWDNLGWNYNPLMKTQEALDSLTEFLGEEIKKKAAEHASKATA